MPRPTRSPSCGRTVPTVSYDPRRQQGVSLYRDRELAFAVGDRIQFTAPANDQKIANRELGTTQGFTDDGRMTLRMIAAGACRSTCASIRISITAMP